ncbi:phage antirepressor KilAC domain-containing protein [Vibrio porteresiae]|uniref:Phage antirepressor KilAC domain-containing protein n=1 Tax=Vibrio porteresiae DSM 19223 TaxID=1123496 RepID=A0ABZ0QAJ1_9VIBR|nr:phage antirepressor KilAC domain-containing protein [Vibrio porteresiae]WPC72945.1 phage antirepressor KilAC domain-containing protein [Vibrio porteresiae DSM 19223]
MKYAEKWVSQFLNWFELFLKRETTATFPLIPAVPQDLQTRHGLDRRMMMGSLILNDSKFISTFDLWNKLNEFRREESHPPIRHGDFLARVEDEIDDLGGHEIFAHPQNHQNIRVYKLNPDQALLVGMRESKVVRKKVLEWIKNLTQPQLPRTYAEALQLAADQAKELEFKDQQLAIAAPKAEFADAIAGASKGVLLGQFAKTVGMGPVTIFRVLREIGIFMSSSGQYNMPYQEYVNRGYFTVKQGTYETNTETRISHTALITGKGEMWLRKKLIDTGHLKAVAKC